MRPLDRLIFQSETVQVGAFACHPHDPRFRDTGPADHYLVVFPRTGVWIRHAGSAAFVADPQVATIYNRGQEYTRAPISSEGDRCDWFGVAAGTAREIAAGWDERAGDDPVRPFRHARSQCSAALYLRQRALFLRLEHGTIDAFEAEEAALSIMSETIGGSFGAISTGRRGRAPTEAQRDLVERARADIVAHAHSPSTLGAMAARLGASTFHLCRVFRRITGTTLHAYRLDLPQRLALEPLAARSASVSRIAATLGFASHSHLTATLRRRLGLTPKALRVMLNGPGTRLPRVRTR